MVSSATLYIISDSLGDTAAAVANAVVSQFPHDELSVERLSKVRNLDEIVAFVQKHQILSRPIVVFHTIVDRSLRLSFIDYASKNGVYEVDLIGPALDAISSLLGEQPMQRAGIIHETDATYFKRIEAMEYTVSHDDGRNVEGILEADIVLIGVSRTSKTPLSLLLASRGYKVANIPLALGMEPPSILFKVDQRRIFGLISTAEVLSEIRYKRLGKAAAVASSYAAPENVQEDIDAARALMRKLGCIVVHTNNRAIEETAQEILRYYKAGVGVE